MKKLLVIASVLCLPLAITSCGGDEKEDDKSKDKVTGMEERAAEITCECAGAAIAAQEAAGDEEIDLKAAYMECAQPYMDELKGKKVNNSVMRELVMEKCPDAVEVLKKLKGN